MTRVEISIVLTVRRLIIPLDRFFSLRLEALDRKEFSLIIAHEIEDDPS